MYLLNLKSSDGHACAVPVRLPDAINFDCYEPGLGIFTACVHPTSLDPTQAEVGVVNVRHGPLWAHVTASDDDAAVEQAGDVLDYVLDRLVHHAPYNHADAAKVLLFIADLAHHEACAWEAWEALPEAVRDASMQRGSIPRNPELYPGKMPSAHALAAYVEVLVGEAQEAATEGAKRRQDAWEEGQREERAAQLRADETDRAVDAHKDGL